MPGEEPYTIQDVLNCLKNGESLEGADLSGSKLMKVDLKKLNLRGSCLQSADLRYADLTRTILENANLKEADLTGAILEGADLSGANLEYAKLDNADLVRANLSKACLKKASFQYASLRATNLTEADFSGANLQYANLMEAKGCLATSFKLTERFFSELTKEKKIPTNVLAKLEDLKHQEYKNEENLLAAIVEKIGAHHVERYKPLILKHAYASLLRKFDSADLRNAKVIDTGMDQGELKAVGAVGDDTAECGWKKKVFEFVKDEDETPSLKERLMRFFRHVL